MGQRPTMQNNPWYNAAEVVTRGADARYIRLPSFIGAHKLLR